MIQLFSTSFYIIIISFLLALTLVFFYLSEKRRDAMIKAQDELIQLAGKDNFFEKKNSILRPDELVFYNKLLGIVGEKYYLFPQIHLSELVKIKNNSRDHDNLYNIIGKKSVDFVVFSKPEMSPVLAIELNGGYHLAFKTQNKDRMKEALFEDIGIKLISVDKDTYKFDELSQKIKANL